MLNRLPGARVARPLCGRKAHLSPVRDVAILAAQFLSMILDISHSREKEGRKEGRADPTTKTAAQPEHSNAPSPLFAAYRG